MHQGICRLEHPFYLMNLQGIMDQLNGMELQGLHRRMKVLGLCLLINYLMLTKLNIGYFRFCPQDQKTNYQKLLLEAIKPKIPLVDLMLLEPQLINNFFTILMQIK